MKKWEKYLFLSIVTALIVIPLIVYVANRNHTFAELVTERMTASEPVVSLSLTKSSSEKQIKIKDPVQIHQIMDNLSTTELVKVQSPHLQGTYSYYIHLKVGDNQHSRARYGLILYSNNYISIYDFERNDKYNGLTYQIKSPYSIQQIDHLYAALSHNT
ncbi:hypothetical protein QE450_001860 [Paenibacillus sp. SORGH_AS306]|uniref:DUF5301 domain-containing protein n=1 Tax=unclassified Paenibacillus TaxID=185978 RepID=UPI002783D812|nr:MULTISPECIES: DUF5301 domain-containing protein [unclassified Paenibacillus]MDQ1234362.1 hypothetical protein [Paenibacillus sp. SORGH_AS_0306]MDR6111408.1 hypothetical protein [Paenibacillus sp. SORGH_AS_0338]